MARSRKTTTAQGAVYGTPEFDDFKQRVSEAAADVKSEPATSVKEPVEVFNRTPVFTARNAGHALAKIGDWFNGPTVEGEPVTMIYEFVVDGHRFTVSIDPLL